MYTILIVDHEADTLDMLSRLLRREGYTVQAAMSAHQALQMVEVDPPDLMVISIAMPVMDGLELTRRVRSGSRSARLPIILLNSADTPFGVADALGAGADDYLRKPFALRELSARIRALLRRSQAAPSELPLLRILPDSLTVYVGSRQVMLTQVEFELLMHLCAAPNQLHSTCDLLAEVWDYPQGAGDTALVRNHVRNLRRKIEDDPERPVIIQSRHGRGYAVRAQVRIEIRSLGSPA